MADIASIKGGQKAQSQKKTDTKIRLSKEQKIWVNNQLRLEERINVCREYTELWKHFFRFIAEDLTQKEITSEEEKQFFQIMTQLGRKQFLFVEMMGEHFERGPEIINVLALSVSLANIQVMPENTRSKLELDWHSLFLDMNKALGRLLREMPGNMSLNEAIEYSRKQSAAGPGAKTLARAGDKSKMLAAVLAFPPMGMLGLDCFYLGLAKKGFLRIITLGGLAIWALVDFYRILTDQVIDSAGRPLV